MKCELPSIERRILAVIQDGFPVSRTPYKDVADKAGISTKELFTVLEDWKKQGKIRRIGAIVNHLKIGLSANAMVVWKVESERVEKAGTILAGFEEVSHCYERQTAENWPYNLYTMVHGANEQDVQQTVARMSEACGVSDYRVLFTEKELKKTPPRYIK
jgi:DNA-binding Lrp family transcriptional regulator